MNELDSNKDAKKRVSSALEKFLLLRKNKSVSTNSLFADKEVAEAAMNEDMTQEELLAEYKEDMKKVGVVGKVWDALSEHHKISGKAKRGHRLMADTETSLLAVYCYAYKKRIGVVPSKSKDNKKMTEFLYAVESFLKGPVEKDVQEYILYWVKTTPIKYIHWSYMLSIDNFMRWKCK